MEYAYLLNSHFYILPEKLSLRGALRQAQDELCDVAISSLNNDTPNEALLIVGVKQISIYGILLVVQKLRYNLL
jgi:hypothetical protein